MNAGTKIVLSDKELELVCNTDWILTKHAVIHKVYHLFGEQALIMQHMVSKESAYFSEAINGGAPKISKGENYLNLPYVILDYPRIFHKEDTVAIRTMFWWGNFFSINLQLSGIYKERSLPVLLKNFSSLQQDGYSICIADNPWKHYFEADNYLLLQNCTVERFSNILHRESFVKIGKTLPLKQWNAAPLFIETSFAALLAILKN